MELTVVDVQGIFSSGKSILELLVARVVDFSVKLSEVRKCRSPHPNYQVLVL